MKNKVIAVILAVAMMLNCNISALTVYADNSVHNINLDTASKNETKYSVKDILAELDYISEATEEELEQICGYYKLDKYMLELSGKQGYVLQKALDIATLAKQLKINKGEFQKLLEIYKNSDNDNREIIMTLKMLKKEKLDSNQTAKVKEQILANNSIDTIIAANKISKALNIDADRLLKKDKKINRDIVSSNAELKEKEKKILTKLGSRYNINIDELTKIAKEQNKSIEKIGIEVSDYELKNGISAANTIMALSTSVSTATESGLDGEKYKEYYNPPFYYRNNTEEYISPGSGSLKIQNIDLSIPGRNGMDLVLTTSYDSAKAGMYRPIGKKNGYGDYDTTMNVNTFEDYRYNIGTGWSFNISFLRQVIYPNEPFDSHVELHLGTGEVYFADKKSNGITYSFDEYEPCDMVLKLDSSYSYTAPPDSAVDTESYYVLQYKDGKKEYFNYDGFLLCIMDRYGNTIRFEYTDPFANDRPLVAKIVDTVGRVTNIWYDETDELGNRYIQIQRPDYNSIVYKLAKSTVDTGEYVIVQRTDPKYYETYYEYEYKTGEVTFDDDKTPKINNFANLTKVTYPTGASSNYTYEMATGMIGSFGYKQYYRVKTRNDEIDEVVNGVVTNRSYYDQKTYSYEGEQSGWPNYDPEFLPDTFTYKSTITDANNNQVIHTFNNKHLDVKEEIKENGTILVKEVSKEYYMDKYPAKETTKIYNSAGQYREYFTNRTYNNYGDITEYTDELGHKTSYQYESKFHQLDYETKEVDAGVTQKTDYLVDVNGNTYRIIQYYTENGVNKSITTDFAYDSYGNMTSSKVLKSDGTYAATSYVYSPTYNYAYLTGKSTIVKDFNGNSQTVKEEYTYDNDTGERLTVKDGNGHITTYDYDSIGRLKKVVNPSVTKRDGTIENSSISMSYSVNSNYIIVTFENGFKTKYQYDKLGRLLEKQNYNSDKAAYVAYERMHYNALGQVASTTLIKDDNTSYTTRYTYDIYNRLLTTVNPDTSFIQVSYDDAANKKTVTDEEKNVEEYYYDNAGNLLKKIVYPDKNDLNNKNITQYQYNYIGKLKSLLDDNNAETGYRYDELGRLTEVVNAKNEATKYKYDNLGNLIEITNPKNEVTKRQYDDLSRLITEEYPVNRKEYFKYDSVGNLIYSKDRKGNEFTYNYDERNRLKEQKLGANTILSYDYDKIGNLLWAENNTGRTSYEYYNNGDLKKVTEADGRYICYEYDNIGNRTKMTDHFGQVIDYGYDNRNRLNTVSIASTHIATYDYYLNNVLKCVTYANGTKEEYSEYDGAKNLKALVNKKADGSTLSSYRYTYDGAGNQETKNENNIITEFDYDTLNRIQTVTQSGTVTQAFTYDSAGNIDSMYSENFSIGVTADYIFNELNQLTQYTESERSPVSYTYYANGLRKTKTVDGITTTYYYDGDNAIIEAEDGSLKYRNIYGMNQIGREDAAGNLYYFLYNGHGDVVSLVDSAGNIKNSYSYDIYGKVTNAVENGIPNPMRYAGQMYDEESGLYYLRARYYDPRVGRFISEDTNKGDINNPSSLNLYTYCLGNPIRYVDLDGHASTGVAEVLYRNPVVTFSAGALSYFAYRMSPYISMLSSNADKVASAKDAANAAKDKYSNSSSSNNPDPNKWDKKNTNINYKISEFANDWQTKGFHLKIDGVEIAMKPGQNGSIVFKQVFSSTSSRSAQQAINKAYQLLQDPNVRQQFYERAINARDYLAKFGTDAATAKAGEINFLIKALEKLDKIGVK